MLSSVSVNLFNFKVLNFMIVIVFLCYCCALPKSALLSDSECAHTSTHKSYLSVMAIHEIGQYAKCLKISAIAVTVGQYCILCILTKHFRHCVQV